VQAAFQAAVELEQTTQQFSCLSLASYLAGIVPRSPRNSSGVEKAG
jgi:hypothetical protein